MSQASKFKDGKVLRAADYPRLSLLDLRTLYQTIETGENSLDDVQRLADIGHKIEPHLGEYYEKIYAATLATRAAMRQGTDAESANMALGIVVEKLDEEYEADDTEIADLILTTNEWEWIMDRWRGSKKFVGIREARERILRITNVLKNALGVKYVNKVAWVEGEPEPGSSGDNTSHSSNGNGRSADTQEGESPIPLRPISIGNS